VAAARVTAYSAGASVARGFTCAGPDFATGAFASSSGDGTLQYAVSSTPAHHHRARQRLRNTVFIEGPRVEIIASPYTRHG